MTCMFTNTLILVLFIFHCDDAYYYYYFLSDKENDYCPSLPTPSGSQLISSESRVIDAEFRYLCDPGLELLSGDLSRHCRGDRTWSGEPANCVTPGV